MHQLENNPAKAVLIGPTLNAINPAEVTKILLCLIVLSIKRYKTAHNRAVRKNQAPAILVNRTVCAFEADQIGIARITRYLCITNRTKLGVLRFLGSQVVLLLNTDSQFNT